MTARDRYISVTEDSGRMDYFKPSYPSNNWHVAHGLYSVFNTRCQDVIDGTHNDHPLTIVKKVVKCEPLNGHFHNSAHDRTYSNYVADLFRYGTIWSISLPGQNDTELRTRAIARSNPSRPELSLPVFVGELKDFPSLFKVAGRVLLKRGANAFLSWNYGWRPLLSDLGTFLDFGLLASRRSAELHSLYQKGGLRRRISLGTDSAYGSDSYYTIESSFGTPVSGKIETTARRKTWATVRWKPTSPPMFHTEQERLKLARRLVYGIQDYYRFNPYSSFVSYAADAWELVPWSWMIDWFGNLGEYLQANRNSVPASCVSCCLMKHTTEVTTFTCHTHPSWVSGGNGSVTRETKSRSLGSLPSLTVGVPFVSWRRLAVIGALGIQRLKL